jgi:Lysine-specific metallo-endopeptidase
MAQQPLRARLAAADSRTGERAPLEFMLANESARHLLFLRWHTPLEGMASNMFLVRDAEGYEVSYRGILAKRGRPRRSEYVAFGPGDSVSTVVDLSDGYDLNGGGTYTVEFRDPRTSQLLTEGAPLARSAGDLDTVRIPSNIATLEVAASSDASRSRGDDDGSAPPAPRAVPAPKTISFDNCDASSEAIVTEMDGTATVNARLAHGYLANMAPEDQPLDAIYQTWFGAHTASRFSTVVSNLDEIVTTFEDSDIAYDCDGPACQPSWIAYVFSGGELKVFLCSGFWSAGTTGFDTQWGTLIHEVSHEVASTNDNAYGQTACQNLAVSDPDAAVDNADSYQLFVEEVVMTVAEGCNAILDAFNQANTRTKALAKRTQRRLMRR